MCDMAMPFSLRVYNSQFGRPPVGNSQFSLFPVLRTADGTPQLPNILSVNS